MKTRQPTGIPRAVFYCHYLKKMVTYDSYDFSLLFGKEIYYIYPPVAQLVEQLPFKERVAGSIPAGRTTNKIKSPSFSRRARFDAYII